MKAGPPFTSPAAYTPGALVAKRSFTLTKPRSSSSTPAASTPRSSVLGTRPAATRRCEARTVVSPPAPRTVKVPWRMAFGGNAMR